MRPSEVVGKAEERLARTLGLGPGEKYPDWLWPLIESARKNSDRDHLGEHCPSFTDPKGDGEEESLSPNFSGPKYEWDDLPTPEQVIESVGVFCISRNTDNPRTWDHLSWDVVAPMVRAAQLWAWTPAGDRAPRDVTNWEPL